MTRVLDKQRTAEARARQARGVQTLDDLFAVPRYYRIWRGIPMAHSLRGLVLATPTRLRPHCPPVRDPATKARHLTRKRARAARKRNR